MDIFHQQDMRKLQTIMMKCHLFQNKLQIHWNTSDISRESCEKIRLTQFQPISSINMKNFILTSPVHSQKALVRMLTVLIFKA